MMFREKEGCRTDGTDREGKMKRQWKKAVLLGGMAALAAMTAGCYGYGYGNYGNMTSRIPKTTAAKDTLEEFDIAGMRAEDGTYQFPGLEWGATKEQVEEALGVSLSETRDTQDGYYADINYSILVRDRISVGFMPVFGEEGLELVSIYFENVYTAEELDTLYDDLVTLCTANFGEPDEVKPEQQTSGGMTFNCETTFWYHQIDETHMTSLQVGKTDTGTGTDGVVLGVNNYNPQEIEEESTDGETDSEETAEEENGSEKETGLEEETDLKEETGSEEEMNSKEKTGSEEEADSKEETDSEEETK